MDHSIIGYVDESEYRKTDEAGVLEKGHLVLAAYVITRPSLALLQDRMATIFSSLEHPYVTNELHAHDLFQSKRAWKEFSIGRAVDLTTSLLPHVRDLGEALFFVEIDLAEQLKQYESLMPARQIAVQFLLERLNDFAAKCQSRIDVVLDEHHERGKDLEALLMCKEGKGFGYRSSSYQWIGKIEYLPSSEHRGLQVADLCAYLYGRRLIQGNKRNIRAVNRMWGQIQHLTDLGEIKVWPRNVQKVEKMALERKLL